MPEFSDYIVFADESGDHGLVTLDPNYPMFVLALCLFTKEEYAGITAPAVMRLKFKHFGHDQVILHEHEIRKTLGHFRFLTDANKRPGFYADLNTVGEEAPFTLVATAIHKQASCPIQLAEQPVPHRAGVRSGTPLPAPG